jgi:hypothetical protein
MHFSPNPYLDPGSGSLLIQLALAALLGIGVFVRSQWARIKRMFGINKDEDKDVDVDNEEGE